MIPKWWNFPLLMIFPSIFMVGIVNGELEEQLLLQFKGGLVDFSGALQNWNSSESSTCQWNGIGCVDFQVASINLHGFNLSGSLSASICGLHFLTIFNVSKNIISGSIPKELMNCKHLEILDLSTNKLHGEIPSELFSLSSLRKLFLSENFLYGQIPAVIGNLTSLEELVIYSNNLSGTLPSSVGMLKSLKIIRAGLNFLSGQVPVELSECASLEILGLAQNRLEGFLPPEFGRLRNLTTLILWENILSGEIPAEFGNFSRLEMLALNDNAFTGRIPGELGKLSKLKKLYLYRNQFGSMIPSELGGCVNALEIDLSENKLTGVIPIELGQIQFLRLLHLFENNLQGSIPSELCLLSRLRRIDLSINSLTGAIPPECQNLTSLEYLELFNNHLDGIIPPLLGSTSNLTVLDLSDNNLTGTIPAHLCKYGKLMYLSLGANRLFGNIPLGVKKCSTLVQLLLGSNQLSGSLPVEFSELLNLSALEMNQNRFSGPISPELGKIKNLERLFLSANYFIGQIPPEIGDLTELVSLNVSSNQFSGLIPHELAKCRKLQRLDLSRNQFSGFVPEAFGTLVNLAEPDAMTKYTNKEKVISIVAFAVGFVSLVLTFGFCWALKRHVPVLISCEDRKNKNLTSIYCLPKAGITYQQLLKATDCFSETSVIGSGGCGTVHRAVMPDGSLIAVKKLKPYGEGSTIDSSFRAEISTLGNIRHRNIVKLYGFCYHQDSNLILYEYMANGSLGELLHGNREACLLDWNTRYNIAFGAAEGLRYLHSDCKPQIIHRDIKSNNILLDEMFEARVGDFGLAKVVDFSNSKTMSAVAGSYGYIAPGKNIAAALYEYAFTMKVTEKCDIYSFGVVLLELITGRTPVQPLELGGDLVNWVRRSLQNMVPTSCIFDDRLDLSSRSTIEEMSLILKIALFCTSDSPFDRPFMKEVIAMMTDARVSSCFPSTPTCETSFDENASSEGASLTSCVYAPNSVGRSI
ncbi:leucine-rich repeat receptor-like serine/threonine-protein kinase At1g17230 [Phalaenopsis equestris]|uniref:leucine-rich repeat receptor-like serine/threonine-protein kinase At1g17230 n=1 Tax=Phalaenopsis equestris TaxID=78828 RepID=UPI0009E34415|nr:leucine-rich repeat receptor-like serine/threonine-protein kinase At1g17230 [Phalaenopsis equestris]